MPTSTQVPNGNGSTIQWNYTISSNWYDVSSDDGDSSYVYINSTSATDRYTVPSLPGDAVSINSCTVGAKFRNTLAGTAWGYVYNGSTNVYLVECAVAGGYQLATTAHYSTSISTINSSEIGIYSVQTGTTNMRCAYCYRYTDYQAAAGGFVRLFLPIIVAVGAG